MSTSSVEIKDHENDNASDTKDATDNNNDNITTTQPQRQQSIIDAPALEGSWQNLPRSEDPSLDENIFDNIKDEDMGHHQLQRNSQPLDPQGQAAQLVNNNSNNNTSETKQDAPTAVQKNESSFVVVKKQQIEPNSISNSSSSSNDSDSHMQSIGRLVSCGSKVDPPDIDAISIDSITDHDETERHANIEQVLLLPSNAPKSKLPLICLKAGLEKKASPLYMQSWTTLALTLDGRDKITKIIQYAARLLAWWYASSNTTKAERCLALKVALINARKAFRLGRSAIEIQRLRSIGLLEAIGWHLHSSYRHDGSIGKKLRWNRKNLVQNLNALLFTIYKPIASVLSYSGQAEKEPTTPLILLLGSAVKLVGLFGFWTADNLAFLAQAGVLDNFALTDKSRKLQRQRMQTRASEFANRSYFIGSVAGLFVAIKAYRAHQAKLQGECENEKSIVVDKAAQAKHFSLFVAVLKGFCDVLVFSNNAGIDFWKQATGRKLHEGLHCVCGLISASTVLYNYFPDADSIK